MTRRPIGSGIAWLLALVLLRSLVPVGFMPAWGAGGFTLVLCEGQGWAPPGGSHHHHHGVDAPAATHAHGEDCSFAQSAHAALVSGFEAAPVGIDVPVGVAPCIESRIFPPDLPRHRAARGPPRLS